MTKKEQVEKINEETIAEYNKLNSISPALEDKISLLFFKTLTFKFQDFFKNTRLCYNEYMILHEVKKIVYEIPDGQLSREFIVKLLEDKFRDNKSMEIRSIIRDAQLRYLTELPK